MKKTLISFLLIVFCFINLKAQEAVNTVVIDASKAKLRISKHIYGHFSEHLGHCIYEGFWVGENSPIPNKNGIRTDVVDALKKINIPNLRWPGGCFADEYHWKDGIGPRNLRPTMINTNWGGVTEDNSFGTHEFLELCNQLNCEPYISGNLGSGTVQEMSQWVEYLNSDNVSPMTDLRKKNGRDKSWGVKYWGVGNESWGCGGEMNPEYYSNLAHHYGSFLKNYGSNTLNKIAVGPNGDDYRWTDVVMNQMSASIWGLSLHYYTWAEPGETATDVTEARWYRMLNSTLKMEELVTKHAAIMDKYDPSKGVSLVVDEWGSWYTVEPGTNPGFLYQQNTIRDALIAGVNLNIFNNHCDRVRMAAVAQVVNVLQSLVLTKEEKMVLTPTYHVFDMYKVHHDALMVPSKLETQKLTLGKTEIPALNISSSIDKNGVMHISVCNLNPSKPELLSCNLNGFAASRVTGKILVGDKLNAHNTFENPNSVAIKDFNGASLKNNSINLEIPARSVLVLKVEGTFEARVPSVQAKDLTDGLKCNYFEGEWLRLQDFANMQPLKTFKMENYLIPSDVPSSNFALFFDGYIEIKKDGMYEFYCTSDDGSRLTIDEEDVVSNDGLHGMIERSGAIFLKKGFHAIQVSFFQRGGGFGFKVQYKTPDGAKEDIPSSLLKQKK